MNPLIGIAASLLPDVIKLIAGDKTGQLADNIVKAVSSATGTSNATDAKAKLDADPAAQTALQQKLTELSIEATKAQNAEADKQRQDQLTNTESARKNLDSLAAIHSSIAWTAPIISYIVIIGFFAFLVLLVWLYHGTDAAPAKTPDTFIVSIINITVGALTAAFATVVNFWLGSSAGSQSKDAAAINLQQSFQKSQSDHAGAAIEALGKSAATSGAVQHPPAAAKTPESAPIALPTPGGMDAFEACMPLIFQAEGGYTVDSGGPTNFGITIKTLEEWEGKTGLTATDVQNLSQSSAKEIYRTAYWNRMQCGALPPGLDLEVFDFGVNAGPSQAVKTLQKIVGVTQDGSIGPITIAAVRTFKLDDLIDQYAKDRISFYQSLPTATTYLKGWESRVNQIQTAALKMVAAGPQTKIA
jgi:hypothetical protein